MEENEALLNQPQKELKTINFITLTIGLLGLQFAWSIELAYGSPYLLELGIESWLLSLVWLAGPLSGLIIQPIIGSWSDKLKWKYGRRKPFILIGTILIIMNLLIIAFPHHVLYPFLHPSKTLILSLVVLAFYALDFSINTVQCSLRALILDVAPIKQQELANAYASRMISLGSIIGFLAGGLDLTYYTNLESIKTLSLLSSLVMLISTLVTLLFVNENIPHNTVVNEDIKIRNVFIDIYNSYFNLPFQIKNICMVQFWCWIGWFPFLFYSTLWISEIIKIDYKNPDFLEYSARIGSMALFINSLITLAFSILLPFITKYNYINKNKLYILCNLLFSILMFLSPFITSVELGIFLISLIGISWSIIIWVPFSLIGEWIQILNRDDSGTILGIHNCYIVIPQFISNFICSLIFAIYKENRFFNGPVALIFFFTCFAAFYAAYLAWRLPTPEI